MMVRLQIEVSEFKYFIRIPRRRLLLVVPGPTSFRRFNFLKPNRRARSQGAVNDPNRDQFTVSILKESKSIKDSLAGTRPRGIAIKGVAAKCGVSQTCLDKTY
jgi:hypothetical protein